MRLCPLSKTAYFLPLSSAVVSSSYTFCGETENIYMKNVLFYFILFFNDHRNVTIMNEWISRDCLQQSKRTWRHRLINPTKSISFVKNMKKKWNADKRDNSVCVSVWKTFMKITKHKRSNFLWKLIERNICWPHLRVRKEVEI